MQLQDGYQAVMPYLIIPNADRFAGFIKKVFNGVDENVFLTDDKKVMHGEVSISGSRIMYADCTDEYTPQPAGLYVNVENADHTFKKALENGAKVVNEMSDKEYGRTGGVKDPFGNTWWITTPPELM